LLGPFSLGDRFMSTCDKTVEFRDYLSEQGLKFTRQRRAIAEVFFGADGHMSLTDLLSLAQRDSPSIGYATVYRTMKLMADGGFADAHRFAEGGEVRYEPTVEGGHHDHLICLQCGVIIEYEDHEIERLQDAIASRLGFEIASHRHEIYGRCVKVDCPELKKRAKSPI
jgi:Fur family transcriptional regulator, ferric uptake regulator